MNNDINFFLQKTEGNAEDRKKYDEFVKKSFFIFF